MFGQLLFVHLIDLQFLNFDFFLLRFPLQLQLALTTLQFPIPLLLENGLILLQLPLAFLLQTLLLFAHQILLLALIVLELILNLAFQLLSVLNQFIVR
jgi:hypothetical protein